MKSFLVEISTDQYDSCVKFAHESIDTSLAHYARRNQANKPRIVEDITIGKCGEFGVYNFLKSLGLVVSEPDVTVYQAGQKSFAADITLDFWQIHCKSQSVESTLKYGASWVLQYGGMGKGHTDKLFKNRSKFDILAPTTVDERCVTIHGFIPVQQLFELDLIEMPKVDWFKDTKRAVYLDSIYNKLTFGKIWGTLSRMDKKIVMKDFKKRLAS